MESIKVETDTGWESFEVPEALGPGGKIRPDDAIGHYLESIGNYPRLTAEEERALTLRIRAGDEEARKKMIECNLRLPVYVARQYTCHGLPVSDLIQEGNLGLMEAVDRYDPGRGTRFSTCAVYWIRHYILRALQNHSKTIRIPVYVHVVLTKIRKAAWELGMELGRKPTMEEITERTGITPEEMLRIQRRTREPLSLDKPLTPETEDCFVDLVPTETVTDPAELYEQKVLKEQVLKALGTLTPRERDVLTMRYGLEDGDPRTLAEIGQELGITRERVRQIEAKAIRKLRHPSRAAMLEDFV